MAAINDIAAQVFKAGEDLPVVGGLVKGLEKIGNIPIIHNIGDQIGDLLRGGKTIDYNSPAYLAQFSADQAVKAQKLSAALDAKNAADAVAAGGVIDYGTTVQVDPVNGKPHLIPVNKYGFVMVNGKQVHVPSTGKELGITVTDQNAKAIGQQILQNIQRGLPVTNQIPGATFDQSQAGTISGAANITSVFGSSNSTAYLIPLIAIVAVVLIFVFTRK